MLPKLSVESHSVNLGSFTESRLPVLLKIQSNELPCALATSCSRLSIDWKPRLSRMNSWSSSFDGPRAARPGWGSSLRPSSVSFSPAGESEMVADSWDAISLLLRFV